MTSEIIELFSTPIKTVQFDNPEQFDQLSKLVYNYLPDNYVEQLDITGGVTTADNLHTLGEFQDIYSMIDAEVLSYLENYLGVNSNDVDMNGMWANVQKSGGVHGVHSHPNSFFSGVLYLNIPSDMSMPGFIHFIDPRQAKNMVQADYAKDHGLAYRAWTFPPRTGLLILFPSWLEHGTSPYINTASSTDRISLSFNYVLNKCSINTMRLNYGK